MGIRIRALELGPVDPLMHRLMNRGADGREDRLHDRPIINFVLHPEKHDNHTLNDQVLSLRKER
jgi:hypothetical protein